MHPDRQALRQIINELDLVTMSALEPPQREQLRRFLFKYRRVFSAQPQAPGPENVTPHRIVTGDAQPFRRRAYRILPLEKAFVDKQLDMNLSAGIVRPSTSPWAAPVVLVKKNKKLRFCVVSTSSQSVIHTRSRELTTP